LPSKDEAMNDATRSGRSRRGAAAAAVPDRVLGVYPQRQGGLYMQRVKVPGGRLNWYQWRRLAELAAAHSGGFPVHTTTRQDVELHNIRADDIAAVQQGLAEVALTTFGACGDSVRNIPVCAACDLCADGCDVLPLARLVQQHLEQQPVVFSLPRKFKISFSGCSQACAKPWLNDLAFVVQNDGRFTVIGAGSLGPKPALGIELYRDVPVAKVLPLCVAAIEFFERQGDRQNRKQARWRHVRERLGDEPFRAELDRRWEEVAARRSWPCVNLPQGRGSLKLQCRLQLPDGNIGPEQILCLAEAAEAAGAVARIDLEHGLVLYGAQPVPLPEDLAALTTAPTIVACPGCVTCPRGLADCWATSAEIRAALAGRDSSGVRINVSGCPNNCGHSAAAEIGLIGMIRKRTGHAEPHYRLLTGGGNGTNDKLAEPGAVIPADHVARAITDMIG
jgi:sulfite reductase beta subunit-like hemoprotein